MAVMTLMFAGGAAQAAPQYETTCISCHNMPPLDTHNSTPANERRNPDTGAVMGNHSTHATSSVSSCTKCHKNEVTTYGTSHRNKQIEFSDAVGYGRKTVGVFMNQTTVLPDPSPTCSTAVCHSNGKGVNRVTPGWGTTAVNCDTCHDATAVTPATGSHTTHISGYTYGCVKCHADHSAEAKPFQHATSAGQRNIDVKFVVAPNVGTGGTFATNQCSNLYCHSNGLGTTKTVTWGGSVDCKSCHNFDLASGSPMASGSHTGHVNNTAVIGSNIGCSSCHATVDAANTIVNKPLHVNASKDFTSANCSSCHKDGKGTAKTVGLTWGTTTLDCAGCHGTTGTFGAPAYVSGGAGDTMANSHAKHASAATDCIKCHGSSVNANGTSMQATGKHTDGTIDVVQGGTATFTYASGTKTCSTSNCHSGGGIIATVASAQWGATLGCAGCHGDAATLATNAHSKHLAKGYTCDRCHSTTASSNTALVAAGAHMNNAANVVGTGITYTNPGTTKNCTTSCHMTATPSWTTASTGACGTCHAIAKTTLTTGSHQKHINTTAVAAPYACASCHAGVVYDGTTASSYPSASHYNGANDYTTCSTQYCHSDGTKATGFTRKVEPVWGTPFTATCASCHGDATAGATQIATGKHTAHLASGIAGIGCATCHSTTVSNNTTIGTVANHVDQKINVTIDTNYGGTYSTNLHLPGAASGSCSTNYCHSNGQATPTYTAPAWSGATLDCQGCHATVGLSAAHAGHLAVGRACIECHSETVSSNTALLGGTVKHINKTRDVKMAGVASYTAGTQTCTTACHMTAAPKWNDLATGDCGTCHGVTSATLTSNAHEIHIATTGHGPKAACTACHTNNGSGAAHVNSTVNLNAGINLTGTCSTCHTVTESWSAAATTVSCQDCHTGSGSTIGVAAPLKSLAATSGHGGQGQDCTACHDSNSDHISGTLGDNNRLKSALGTDNANCLYCHNTTGTVTNPAMLNMVAHQASGLGSKCADCHDAHGTSNTMMVNSTINGTAVSFTGNNTFANGANNGVCQVCHTTTTYFKANGTGAAHVDSTENCLRCHSHNPAGTGNLAFMPNGGCDACHGYPPIPRNVDLTNIVKYTIGNYSGARFEDYSGGGGAHIVAAHLSPNVRPGDGFAPCLTCHQNAEASHVKAMPIRANMVNVTVKVDPKHRLRNDVFPVYTSAKFVNGGGNQTGRCFNVDCHFKKSEKWSNVQ